MYKHLIGHQSRPTIHRLAESTLAKGVMALVPVSRSPLVKLEMVASVCV